MASTGSAARAFALRPTHGGGSSTGAGASPARLARRLGDRRFKVRDRAVTELARQGDQALPALRKVLHEGLRSARLAAVGVADADRRGRVRAN